MGVDFVYDIGEAALKSANLTIEWGMGGEFVTRKQIWTRHAKQGDADIQRFEMVQGCLCVLGGYSTTCLATRESK